MPYSGGENPKAGDTVKDGFGAMGTVFELDPRTGESADKERIKVKFDDGRSIEDAASKFALIKRASE